MKIKIEGVPIYDGEYDCGSPYTVEEWRVFKQIGGILPMDLATSAMSGDVDVIVCYALIGLRRGGVSNATDLMFSTFDPNNIFTLDVSDEVVDADPPPLPSEPNASESNESSGTSSRTDGDSIQANDLNGTGSPRSETSVESGPVISGA